MRNIPMFATECGVASLTLQDIPYRGMAYIKIQSTAQPKEFLDECVGFCIAAGAEKVYAAGHDSLDAYPLHTALWQMSCPHTQIPDTDAALFPVTEKTLEAWCAIYNEKMACVPNASYMSRTEGEKMLQRGDGYFVHLKGELLGIGIASADTIHAVVGVKPGAGAQVLSALCNALASDMVRLEVSSVNAPAIRLYDRMGFICTAEVSRWYQVYPEKLTD